MSDELLGDDFNLFWDSTGDFDNPSWQRQISIGDLGFDPANEQVEIPKRIRTKVYKKGRGDWTLSFTSNYSRGSNFHRAVLDAVANGTKIHLAICDGDDIDDPEATYWHGWWLLTGPVSGSLDEAASIEVEGHCHHDTGEDDSELPELVVGST